MGCCNSVERNEYRYMCSVVLLEFTTMKSGDTGTTGEWVKKIIILKLFY